MTTIIEGIAERIGDISYSDLPREAVHWAKAAILDTVGVTLAGAAEPCTQIVARVLRRRRRSEGECLIFGTDRRAAPLDAALINGTAAHALDFDDVSNSMGGHPSAPIVPALFALGEIARQHRARLHRRLCRRVRDRDPHRPRRQSASLRKGLAPDRDAGRVRRGRRLLSSDGSATGRKPRRRWRSPPRSRRASRPISAR